MAPARKKATASKKAGAGRKYAPAASKSVEREMRAFKEGKLRSGNGRKVTNPKQAIAIGLSEPRRSGAEMPGPPPDSASAEKSAGRKTAAKKAPARKSAAKKTAAKKTSAKKAPAKKTAAKKTSAKKTPARKTAGSSSSKKRSER